MANFWLGCTYHVQGDYRRAVDLLGRVVDSLEGDLIRERFGMAGLPSVLSRSWLTWCLAERGEFAEGIERAEEGIRIAEAVDQPFSLSVAYFGAGLVYLRKGDLREAVPLLESGLGFRQMIPIWFLPCPKIHLK